MTISNHQNTVRLFLDPPTQLMGHSRWAKEDSHFSSVYLVYGFNSWGHLESQELCCSYEEKGDSRVSSPSF